MPSILDGFQEGGRTEILAACGYEAHSQGDFTKAFIEECRLRISSDTFSVAQLHQRLLLKL
jgi:hypothetical protein